MRAILTKLAFVFAGPLTIFITVTLGCQGRNPILGEMCGHNAYSTLALGTVGAWFLTAAGWAVRSVVKHTP